MTSIYVDADACPVKNEVLKVAGRYDLAVFLVSNAWLMMPVGPRVEKIVVSDGADAADDWIVEHVEAGDIVITNDIPLAARVLDKGAAALGAKGRAFTEQNIGSALAGRAVSAHLRETGEDRGFSPAFTKKDRSEFLVALDRMVTQALRTKP